MVTAAAAAAVVAKNARLFIVTSLEMFFRTPTGLYSNSGMVVRMLGTVAWRPGGNVTGITPHVVGLPLTAVGMARGPSADDAMHQLRCGNGNAAVSVNVHKGNTIVSDSCSQGSCNLRCGPTRPGNGWLALGMET